MGRICFVLEVFPQLSETFILDQVHALHERGHEVHIVADTFANPDEQRVLSPLIRDLCQRGRPRWPKQVLAKAVLHRLPGRWWERIGRAFDRFADCQLQAYDILIAHFGSNGLRLAHSRLAGCFDTPFLCIFHGKDVGVPAHEGRLFIYRPLFDQAEALLTVNAHFRTLLISAGAPAERLRIHHMGVVPPAQISSVKIDPNGLRLISVCRLVEKKGLTYAIAALQAVAAVRPDICFQYDIVGNGPQLETLKEQAERAGLSDRIRFLGAIAHDEVKELLTQASVFVLPSVTGIDGDVEGIPVALMEAMAAGLITISTRHSGIPELIKDGISGFLAQEHDSTAIARHIAWIFDHPNEAAKLGLAGRRTVQQEFNKTTQDEAFAELVEDLVAKSHCDLGKYSNGNHP